MPARRLHASTRLTVAHSQSWRCVGERCKGAALLPAEFEVHHVFAFSLGGEDLLGNLQALCPSCHAIHSRREQPWIMLAKRVRTVTAGREHLCVQCKRVLSPHFEHVCGGWQELRGQYDSLLATIREQRD